MFDPGGLIFYSSAALLLAVMPGPAVLYIVARSLEQGRGAGMVSVLGIGVGSLFHVVLAALGLSALLLTSPLAFGAVRLAGATYLVYLGVRTLLRRERLQAEATVVRAPLGRIFLQGVVVNVLNPKTALFFLAFLPQFVDPQRGAAALQALVLGLLFVLIALVTDSAYALLAGNVNARLRARSGPLRAQRIVSGVVLLGLGVGAALAGRL